MSISSLVWLVIFGLAAVCFFSVAAIVSVKGLSDLKDLLHISRRSGTSKNFPERPI